MELQIAQHRMQSISISAEKLPDSADVGKRNVNIKKDIVKTFLFICIQITLGIAKQALSEREFIVHLSSHHSLHPTPQKNQHLLPFLCLFSGLMSPSSRCAQQELASPDCFIFTTAFPHLSTKRDPIPLCSPVVQALTTSPRLPQSLLVVYLPLLLSERCFLNAGPPEKNYVAPSLPQ